MDVFSLTLNTAHKDQFITAGAPRAKHMSCLRLMVLGIGHHPTEHTDIVVQLLGHRSVLQSVGSLMFAVFAGVFQHSNNRSEDV